MKHRRSGFSLVEILVVVAIIGVISLVSVPNFIAMQRNGKLKSSMRRFITDVRSMRQRAVTRHTQTKISFQTGTATTARGYSIWELDPATSTWTRIADKTFEETCYVSNQTNFDTNPAAPPAAAIIFKPDGTPLPPPTYDPTKPFSVVVKTDWNLPKSNNQCVTGQYTITITMAGAAQAC
jgi:type II secretion system protein H